MHVIVNHLGYERRGPKRAFLRYAAGDRHADGVEHYSDTGVADTFRVVDAHTNGVVFEGEPALAGHVDDWQDWIFWTLEFAPLDDAGTYYVAVDGDEGEVRSRRFEIAENLVEEAVLSDVLFYFKSQRSSGAYDRADRSVPFVGERADEVDVHGGWYDASGDMSKYLSHLSYANYLNPQQIPVVVWGLLDAYERLLTYDHPLGEQLGERVIEESLHGADFLVRMLDDEGYFYVTVFDRWTHDPEQREICAFETMAGDKYDDYQAGYRQGGGVAIAALARASTLNGPSDYDGETYLEAAITGFDHLEGHNEAYLNDGVENVIDDYCALLAATELFAVTGENRFERAASERARSLLDRQTADERYAGWWRADEHGDRPFFHAAEEGFPVVSLLRYLEVVDESPGADVSLTDEILDAIEAYWRFELEITAEVVNPFGYPRQYVKAVDEDESHSSFFIPHENETGYWWQGENARIASLAAAAFRSFEWLDDDSLRGDLVGFGCDQLHWILGANPYDTCMVGGIGSNPPDFHPEFRSAPGGIVNGITTGVEDESDVAFYPGPYADDPGHRWRWFEQWIPHAAWFFVAASWHDANEFSVT